MAAFEQVVNDAEVCFMLSLPKQVISLTSELAWLYHHPHFQPSLHSHLLTNTSLL